MGLAVLRDFILQKSSGQGETYSFSWTKYVSAAVLL